MIVKTIGKFSNEFTTMSQFNKEYKALKEDFSKQAGINYTSKLSNIIVLWGDLSNNNNFIKITDNKSNMMERIKLNKGKNVIFKLELLNTTLKINGRNKMNNNFNLVMMYNIEDFVRKNKETLNEIDWENISKNKNLTENFIREFEEDIDWFYISCFQNLSENFLLEFKNKIYWNNISYNKNLSLSKNFTKKFNTK